MRKSERLHDQLAELKASALARLVEYLRREHDAVPVMAVELEFYLSGAKISTYPKAILATLDNVLQKAGIAAHPAEEERGQGQYEVALKPLADLSQLAQAVQQFPAVVSKSLHAEGYEADFSPKPHREDFGNGMHWHIHIETPHGKNLFWRDENDQYSRELIWSLGGLLETLPEAMLLFAPNPASYARFQTPKMNAPTTLSWGANNRTTALRLPNKPLNCKHIEHRVAGGDADPWLCILGILTGIAYGLSGKFYPGEAIYGDASDPQYDCEALPDYHEAVRLFGQSAIMQKYLGEDLCAEVMRRAVYPDAF